MSQSAVEQKCLAEFAALPPAERKERYLFALRMVIARLRLLPSRGAALSPPRRPKGTHRGG